MPKVSLYRKDEYDVILQRRISRMTYDGRGYVFIVTIHVSGAFLSMSPRSARALPGIASHGPETGLESNRLQQTQ